MGGVYDIPLIAFQTRGVFTNTTPVDAYRGAGKPEANYLIERCIDIAARQTRDRCAEAAAQEHLSPLSPCKRDGAFGRAGQLCATRSIMRSMPLAGFDARRRSSRKRGRLRGLGYACFLETVARPAQ